MITQGNDKLGPLVWGWSIPAKRTCPGMSAVCKEICYAATGRFIMPNVKDAHRRNYKLSKTPHFVSWMSGMLREFCVTTLRIHVAGDFYDPLYIAKWHTIVKQNRRVQFFTYTRSWTEPAMVGPLQELSAEPNMRFWLSWDADMDVPPKWQGVRRCYLAQNDEDRPPKGKADLIFRDQQSTVMKYAADGTLVCCYDNGVDYGEQGMSCSKCQLCWLKRRIPRKPTDASISSRKKLAGLPRRQ